MTANAESFSPSAAKPALAVESWKELNVPIKTIAPQAVTTEQLSLAHDADYVKGVLNCTKSNGFGNRLPDVAAALPFTSGAMLAAAREAISNGLVAIAPVSGFHHAGYFDGGGYCTFNGLMVTAMMLGCKVGILDFDQHYGNGTDDIIRHLQLDDVVHYTAGNKYHDESQAEEFLERIPNIMKQFTDCEVILYQAGADPHIDDPLGGWLSTEQMFQRDRLVFETAKAMGLPVAWDLAGGYQKDIRAVLDIHDNTMRACWAVYGTCSTLVSKAAPDPKRSVGKLVRLLILLLLHNIQRLLKSCM